MISPQAISTYIPFCCCSSFTHVVSFNLHANKAPCIARLRYCRPCSQVVPLVVWPRCCTATIFAHGFHLRFLWNASPMPGSLLTRKYVHRISYESTLWTGIELTPRMYMYANSTLALPICVRAGRICQGSAPCALCTAELFIFRWACAVRTSPSSSFVHVSQK